MNLACPNCKKEVPENDVKWFGGDGQASVFCCPSCHVIATTISQHGKKLLKDLMLMLDEGIRVSLADGRCHLPEGVTGQPTKEQMLKAILQLQDWRDERRPKQG